MRFGATKISPTQRGMLSLTRCERVSSGRSENSRYGMRFGSEWVAREPSAAYTRSMTINVLVLCTGNSARSILGEVLINELGRGRLRAWSAGSHPVGQVNPGALQKLAGEGHETAGLSSKSWDQFSGADAPPVDIVITVCDNAAGEACPLWNGAPVTVHWGIPDPAADGDFDAAYTRLRRRVEAMLALPLEDLDAAAREHALRRVHVKQG